MSHCDIRKYQIKLENVTFPSSQIHPNPPLPLSPLRGITGSPHNQALLPPVPMPRFNCFGTYLLTHSLQTKRSFNYEICIMTTMTFTMRSHSSSIHYLIFEFELIRLKLLFNLFNKSVFKGCWM